MIHITFNLREYEFIIMDQEEASTPKKQKHEFCALRELFVISNDSETM